MAGPITDDTLQNGTEQDGLMPIGHGHTWHPQGTAYGSTRGPAMFLKLDSAAPPSHRTLLLQVEPLPQTSCAVRPKPTYRIATAKIKSESCSVISDRLSSHEPKAVSLIAI